MIRKKIRKELVATIILISMICICFILQIPSLISAGDPESQPVSQSSPQAPVLKGQCPKTKVVGDVSDCFRCHVPVTFRLREPDPLEHIRLPMPKIYPQIDKDGNIEKVTWFLDNIDSEDARRLIDWCRSRNIKHVVIEIQSPGGSLFEAWRIVGLIREAQKDMVVETRCYGFAASAGFLVLVSGSKGHRFASRTAHLMWHELLAFSLFKVETPSSSEETSRVLRKFQDIANTYIATNSCSKKEDLDNLIKNKNFWLSGEEALKYCFIDGLIEN